MLYYFWIFIFLKDNYGFIMDGLVFEVVVVLKICFKKFLPVSIFSNKLCQKRKHFKIFIFNWLSATPVMARPVPVLKWTGMEIFLVRQSDFSLSLFLFLNKYSIHQPLKHISLVLSVALTVKTEDVKSTERKESFIFT